MLRSNIPGMHQSSLVSSVRLTLLILVFATIATAQTVAPEISFSVAMPQPHTHLFDVEINIKRGPADNVPADERLVMPVWTPGSYLIREFQRHVQDFEATDAAGQPLKWEKINKNTWRVLTNGGRDWRA